MVQEVPVFRRGEVLNVFFQGDGIRLRFKGVAQEDGFEGKYVSLKRKSNGKLLKGKVVYGNNVLIY
jgi:flagella basal body P-ring formation protein FlgA